VVTSARGRTFVDADPLDAMTGHPVRSDYKNPGEPELLPPADALIVAPATTNTINKCAAGISGTLPHGLLVEGIGKGPPIVAMPFTNRAQAAHLWRVGRLGSLACPSVVPGRELTAQEAGEGAAARQQGADGQARGERLLLAAGAEGVHGLFRDRRGPPGQPLEGLFREGNGDGRTLGSVPRC
jgi:hypothetical protein